MSKGAAPASLSESLWDPAPLLTRDSLGSAEDFPTPPRGTEGACSAAHVTASASFCGPGTMRFSTKLKGALLFLQGKRALMPRRAANMPQGMSGREHIQQDLYVLPPSGNGVAAMMLMSCQFAQATVQWPADQAHLQSLER